MVALPYAKPICILDLMFYKESILLYFVVAAFDFREESFAFSVLCFDCFACGNYCSHGNQWGPLASSSSSSNTILALNQINNSK